MAELVFTGHFPPRSSRPVPPCPCRSPQCGAARRGVTVTHHQTPGSTPLETPLAGQKISPACPQPFPRAEAMSLPQAGPLPAPVTCLSPARPGHPRPPAPLARDRCPVERRAEY